MRSSLSLSLFFLSLDSPISFSRSHSPSLISTFNSLWDLPFSLTRLSDDSKLDDDVLVERIREAFGQPPHRPMPTIERVVGMRGTFPLQAQQSVRSEEEATTAAATVNTVLSSVEDTNVLLSFTCRCVGTVRRE